MVWIPISAIEVNNRVWQYSQTINSNAIRISHQFSHDPIMRYGYFCQAQFLLNGKVERYLVRRLYLEEDYTIIKPDYRFASLYSNSCRFGIKGQRKFIGTPSWIVDIEVWV